MSKAPRKLKRKKAAQPEDVRYPALDATLEQMDRLIREGLANRQQFFKLEAWVLKFMESKGIDAYNGANFRGTPVRPTTEIVYWDKIKEKLGPVKWKKILGEPQPDKSKLEALMELGEISVEDIAECLEDKTIKPHVKLTRIQKG
jgi:hypothetical protein